MPRISITADKEARIQNENQAQTLLFFFFFCPRYQSALITICLALHPHSCNQFIQKVPHIMTRSHEEEKNNNTFPPRRSAFNSFTAHTWNSHTPRMAIIQILEQMAPARQATKVSKPHSSRVDCVKDVLRTTSPGRVDFVLKMNRQQSLLINQSLVQRAKSQLKSGQTVGRKNSTCSHLKFHTNWAKTLCMWLGWRPVATNCTMEDLPRVWVCCKSQLKLAWQLTDNTRHRLQEGRRAPVTRDTGGDGMDAYRGRGSKKAERSGALQPGRKMWGMHPGVEESVEFCWMGFCPWAA